MVLTKKTIYRACLSLIFCAGFGVPSVGQQQLPLSSGQAGQQQSVMRTVPVRDVHESAAASAGLQSGSVMVAANDTGGIPIQSAADVEHTPASWTTNPASPNEFFITLDEDIFTEGEAIEFTAFPEEETPLRNEIIGIDSTFAGTSA